MIFQRTNSRRPGAARRSGVAIVETAVVLPIVLVFILGALDFAHVMYANGTVSEAARAGARYAIVHGSMAATPSGPTANDANVASTAQSYALALDPTQLTVTSSWGNGNNFAGSPVTVTATYNCYLSVGKLVGLGTITVQGTTTMIITH
jgi:Flp pilus assembly protein TadG